MAGTDSKTNEGDAGDAVLAPEQFPAKLSFEQHMSEFSKTPLFMDTLDAEEAGDSNPALEAIRALAYEGEPQEIAQNFRNYGNESYQEKSWQDAVEFYTKALAVKCGIKEIDEACYANRAAVNLELKNYRRVNLDCAEALKLNPRNVKALYRSARACLALDKLPEAQDCADRGLAIDPSNKSLISVSEQIAKRKTVVDAQNKARQEREATAKAKENAIKIALKLRNITEKRTTNRPPDLGDTPVSLEDPTDPKSMLSFPVMVLYPLDSQSDFIQSFPEAITPYEQLTEILAPDNPPPWDTRGEYRSPDAVDVFVERKKWDMHGKAGLSKVGKNITLGKVLSEGKAEFVDGMVSLLVVPKPKVNEFIEGWKKKNLV